MNKFEMQFVDDLKRLGLKRQDVAQELEITITTLKSKLRNPKTFSIGQIIKLQQLNFKLEYLWT